MRGLQMGSAAVAVLGAAALVVGWTPSVFGQQTFTVTSDQAKDRTVVVETRQPGAIVRERLSGPGGGGHIGVSVRDVTTDDIAKLKLAGQSGTLIDDVAPDSPAAKAGVAKNDIVVSFDGENVRSAAQFARLVRETPPGRTIQMAVMRDGKRTDLTVTPDDSGAETFTMRLDGRGVQTEIERQVERLRPELDAMRERRYRPMPRTPMMLPPNAGVFRWYDREPGDRVFALADGQGRLGVTVQDLSPELAEFFAVKDGVLVSSVGKDTPAANAGIKAGDVITAVDGSPVESSRQLVDQLRGKKGDVTLAVMREKKAVTLKATLEDKPTPKPTVTMREIPS